MRRWDDKRDGEENEEEERRRTRGLLAFALVLLLAIVAIYLIQRLRQEGAIEDCLFAGHSNCDTLVDEP